MNNYRASFSNTNIVGHGPNLRQQMMSMGLTQNFCNGPTMPRSRFHLLDNRYIANKNFAQHQIPSPNIFRPPTMISPQSNQITRYPKHFSRDNRNESLRNFNCDNINPQDVVLSQQTPIQPQTFLNFQTSHDWKSNLHNSFRFPTLSPVHLQNNVYNTNTRPAIMHSNVNHGPKIDNYYMQNRYINSIPGIDYNARENSYVTYKYNRKCQNKKSTQYVNGYKRKKIRSFARDKDTCSFYCEACDRGYNDEEKFQEHKTTHIKCQVSGCRYVAAQKLVEIHYKTQHKTGLGDKIWKVESEKDIEQWREERKKNYPSAKNVVQKNAERENELDKGCVIKTEYFGKMYRSQYGQNNSRKRNYNSSEVKRYEDDLNEAHETFETQETQLQTKDQFSENDCIQHDGEKKQTFSKSTSKFPRIESKNKKYRRNEQRNTESFNNREFYSKKGLLQKLLANDIRRERNYIFQCARFIVRNNFFDRENDITDENFEVCSSQIVADNKVDRGNVVPRSAECEQQGVNLPGDSQNNEQDSISINIQDNTERIVLHEEQNNVFRNDLYEEQEDTVTSVVREGQNILSNVPHKERESSNNSSA